MILNNIIHNQHSYINIFIRGFPIYLPIIFIILYFNTKFKYYLNISFGVFIIGLFIPIIKNIFIKPINNLLYSYTNIDNYSIPILGTLTRPIGAKNANFFYYGENNYSYSMGMPSGHSMSAAFISTYTYLYLINKYNYDETKKNKLYNFLILFTLYAMYSRAYIFKVHTIQQTIIGAYLGYLIGIYYYKLIEKLNEN